MPFSQPNGPLKIDPRTLKAMELHAHPAIAMAKAFVEADVQVQPSTMSYALKDQKDNFARVTVGVQDGGGFYVLLKQVNDIWIPLIAGQDAPGTAFGQKYGLPEGWFSTEY